MPMVHLVELWQRLVRLIRKDIWQTGELTRRSLRGATFAVLRVITITWTVFNETKAASRAAALSFSSLLGLGPLVALTVLVAGFALDNKDPDLAANTLSRLINFVAPQVGQLSKLPPHRERPGRLTNDGAARPPAAAAAGNLPASNAGRDRSVPDSRSGAAQPDDGAGPANPDLQLNPRLVRMVDNFINQGRSGSAGTVGFFSLVLIVLLLFKTIEDTFNEIWGVRSGRSLLMRVVYYWTILTLGAVLFFASVTLLGAGAFLNVFNDAISHLPFSQQVAVALQWSLPLFSFTLLVVLLTIFYRVIPHTKVRWEAAAAGALVVASLLMLNNYLAFLYVRRVILTESLYGSLGFALVVMFGLYIFWLYVLIGGQISYAVQNVHFRNSKAAWAHLSKTMRERLSLVVLLTICRRFQNCQPPASASQLGEIIKVPTQILNECLNRLVDLKLITPLPAANDDNSTDLPFQPARPLNRITLLDFKRLDDDFGEAPVTASLEHVDPLLQQYTQAVGRLGEQEFFRQNLEQLLAAHPFSGPPVNRAGTAGASG